ncbi:hypothetical protein [Actinomadura rupiterrae]|uniref:hypothetical protein n=1 Tax=Actinomadura rupiterrae TaxID=559627 RepID=UPI0020A34236|nr:hypothetical protein [Actinomadura rupiterrae]MCP2339158.1 hypothetical protein [Actinomadura rupiterrae]
MVAAWKFVDQPIASPTVLLDMNDGNTWATLREGFDVSPPSLRRSIVTNAMSDGGFLTSAAYDLRELRFTLQLSGITEADRYTQLKAFEREVAKPSNLLMYKPDLGSNPVFFRTLRSDTFTLDNQFIPGQAWRINASVLAEPFAIGTRVDLAAVTVTNDPAAGSNPSRIDMTGILGDAPSPAFVRLGSLAAGTSMFLAQRTTNNPGAVTLFAQAESGTMGTDTTATAGTASFSGSGNKAATTTFATATGMTTRLTYTTLPSATSAEALRGRYRVLLRASVAAAATTSTYQFRFQQLGNDTSSGPTVTATITNGTFQLIDLGVMEFPPSLATPVSIGYSALAAGYATSQFGLQVSRASGTASLDMDYLYLLPADERLCAVYQAASSGYLILDGPNDTTYCMAAGTSPFGATPSNRMIDNAGGLVPRIGGLPVLVPGVTNRWYLLTDTGTITNTKSVEVSYWPRWREVAP